MGMVMERVMDLLEHQGHPVKAEIIGGILSTEHFEHCEPQVLSNHYC